MKQGNINGHNYNFIKSVIGESTGYRYWILKYTNGENPFTFGYTTLDGFAVMGCEFETLEETEKYIQKRDDMVSDGETVMF